MIDWNIFINALGKDEMSSEFVELCTEMGEQAHLSEDPDEYNDPIGKTRYFKFISSGVEIGFRQDILNHIYFFFRKEGGYMPFKGFLVSGIDVNSNEQEVLSKLGKASVTGGGKSDMLLGYIKKWMKYVQPEYSFHLQFDHNDKLCRATLMK